MPQYPPPPVRTPAPKRVELCSCDLAAAATLAGRNGCRCEVEVEVAVEVEEGRGGREVDAGREIMPAPGRLQSGSPLKPTSWTINKPTIA